jgi:biotin transport system substrate-specific component
MAITNIFVRLTHKAALKLRTYHLDYLVLLPLFFFIASQTILPLPFLPIPVSIQPLPIFLAAWFFGYRGVAGYATYLVQGLLGAPIFSGFSGGITHLLGPTGGYLIGFLLGAIIIACLKKNVHTKLEAYGAYALATATSIILGVAHLVSFMPVKAALACGCIPFIIGDFAIKPALFILALNIKSQFKL